MYPAGIAGRYKWGGGLGAFVLQVVVTLAEPSVSDRMAEQGGLVVIVQLKVKLRSEVQGLGGREGKQTLSVCPQLLGELWLSKEQGQMREKSFVSENLCHQIPNAAADSYLSTAAACRCEADTEICLIRYSYLQRFNKKCVGCCKLFLPSFLQ